ncbi:hypothetical protein IPJ72_05920 [Candidatus Peregrinibacteria bacterium]|nr:MAG: hypothetical protein IPJ72_05920 [Candidatus Peregrinibacteria bacterium]
MMPKLYTRQFPLISVSIALFVASVYLAYHSVVVGFKDEIIPSVLSVVPASELMVTGVKAQVASWFAGLFQILMGYTAHNLFLAIFVLAFLVELVLLYPSVSIQIKQKKIHLFHKKIVDRFRKGELTLSKTRSELAKIYEVNETIHRRGAVLVVIQIALFFSTVWGLNFLMSNESFLAASWSTLNASLLTKSPTVALSALISLSYLFHSLIKIYFKERQDYIAPAQVSMALVFALLGSGVMYAVSNLFPVAVSVYLITLISFSTLRYAFIEQNAHLWKGHAQSELIRMLQNAQSSPKSWVVLSRWWNHLPITRALNTHLMEEALSMSLSLLIMVTLAQ